MTAVMGRMLVRGFGRREVMGLANGGGEEKDDGL